MYERYKTMLCWAACWVLVIVLMMTCSSCRPCRNLTRERSERDSVRVETRSVVCYVPDTVFVEIPAQAAERTTADSTSHLENDYATSDARILPDGSLFHSLSTKPQRKPVGTERKVERIDSIVYTGHTEQEEDRQVVEVTPSWARHVLLYAVAVTILAVFLLRRKP